MEGLLRKLISGNHCSTLGTFSAAASCGLHFKLGSWNKVFLSPRHQARVHMQVNIQWRSIKYMCKGMLLPHPTPPLAHPTPPTPHPTPARTPHHKLILFYKPTSFGIVGQPLLSAESSKTVMLRQTISCLGGFDAKRFCGPSQSPWFHEGTLLTTKRAPPESPSCPNLSAHLPGCFFFHTSPHALRRGLRMVDRIRNIRMV